MQAIAKRFGDRNGRREKSTARRAASDRRILVEMHGFELARGVLEANSALRAVGAYWSDLVDSVMRAEAACVGVAAGAARP